MLAEAQRVMTKEKITPNEIPDLETEEMPVSNVNRNQQAPMISHVNNKDDDYIQPPAANTQQQQQTRTLMQEYMMHMMELPGNKVTPFTPQQAAS